MKSAVFRWKWILLLFLLIVLWPAAGIGRTVLKLATVAPEGSVWMNTFNRMNSEIEAVTGGEVKFKVYAGGVLGGDKDILRLILMGGYPHHPRIGPGLD